MTTNKSIKNSRTKNSIYNGTPSIVLDHRPFFSIVVPCYNAKDTIKELLDSILDQEMEDDLEVILADDCSTKSYQDIVEPYLSQMSIKRVKTNYNFGPGNTRERGVAVAEGEWICFADQDDTFIENSLHNIKKIILESNEKYYAIANFIEFDPEHGIPIREMKETQNWCHAKFYNLDNLWNAFGIQFVKDLSTHEDIAISSQVNCVLSMINKDPLYINNFCYLWMARPNSLSRRNYGDKSFLEKFLNDYITSTGEIYLNIYLNQQIDPAFILHSVIEVILHLYFYMQRFKFKDPNNYDKDNEQLCRKFYTKVKKIFQISNEVVWAYVAENDAILYNSIKHLVEINIGTFIEHESFMDWLNILHEDIKTISINEISNSSQLFDSDCE